MPGYTTSGDPDADDVVFELGLGRERVLSREGRVDAAARWYEGDGGPDTAMARNAPAHCGTCGFLLPLAGSLRILSQEFRLTRASKAEEKGARMPALMTVPLMVFILPTLIAVLLAPAIMSAFALT